MSELELLNALLTATRGKRLAWRQVGPNRFEASVNGFPCIIDYQWPLLADGGVSNVALVRVVVTGVRIAFAEGTPQDEVVEQILAATFPEWAETTRIMEEERVAAAERLMSLIEME